MNDDLEKTIPDLKTTGLNNSATYVLTHNKFNNYMSLNFTDLKKAQIYIIPYRNSPHQEIEILTRFAYLDLFIPKNNENFLFKIGDKKIYSCGRKII